MGGHQRAQGGAAAASGAQRSLLVQFHHKVGVIGASEEPLGLGDHQALRCCLACHSSGTTASRGRADLVPAQPCLLSDPACPCWPPHPTGSYTQLLSRCGQHRRPRQLALREAQSAFFSHPDEIASMPVSLQTLKPAADRANPRIGVGALAFSPDNYFLATRNGQWPIPCVLSPCQPPPGPGPPALTSHSPAAGRVDILQQ